jgi:hypothetical protein
MAPHRQGTVEVYLEVGAKRTFAGALEWPGWCRAGRDETSALSALLAYAPRYATVVAGSVPFGPPRDARDLRVGERLRGDASTDFGAPGQIPAADERPMTKRDLARSRTLLEACWSAFDRAVADARGHELRKGPRGGGRDVDQIVDHVLGAEKSYVSQVGASALAASVNPTAAAPVHEAALAALEAAAEGKFPKRGPRGGRRWPPRYFVRRAAWHVLDHAWEIEDRATSEASTVHAALSDSRARRS